MHLLKNNFTKMERLKKNNEFIFIFKKGKWIKGNYYSCKFIKNNFYKNRLGIVIKKKLGIAVRRNYEKRILRELFRNNKQMLTKNFDLIFSIIKIENNFLEKEKEFKKILQHIQIS